MFLFQNHPPCHIPPTVYLLQPGLTHVVHGKLPGFVPTPAMYMYKIKTKIKSSNASQNKNKNSSQFTLRDLRSVAQLVPVFVSTDTTGQLDVPWLNCKPLGMDGE